MQAHEDILSLIRQKVAEVTRQTQRRAVILQPGAIGDCVLTLPLAQFMKDSLGLGGIDILGHTEYIGILPGRTCIDGVRSMDSINLHRLFVNSNEFDLADGDPLISLFSDYTWIVTFLGEPYSDFEQNLIFTANCSRSAEIITLSMKPPENLSRHITEFHAHQFINQSGLSLGRQSFSCDRILIKASRSDKDGGKVLLTEAGIDLSKELVVIQPGSGGLRKRCYLGNFLAIADNLRSHDVEVVFLLGPAELERLSNNEVRDIGSIAQYLTNLSLTQVLGVLSCADQFVGNDSGITHLAAELGIKTLAIFGPTDPVIYRPVGPDVTVITSSSESFAEEPSASLQQEIVGVLLA
jgi:heptosyltransferase-3